VMRSIADSERDKYRRVWELPDYYKNSPGLTNVERFRKLMCPSIGASLIDVGCGTGGAGLELQDKGLSVWWLDITDAALDDKINRDRFIELPLWSPRWRAWAPIGKKWDYGFCCDVMEHMPPEYSLLALDRILSACRICWFQIALFQDGFGDVIGERLHLTVRPFEWWRDAFKAIGAELIEARHLLQNALYVAEYR